MNIKKAFFALGALLFGLGAFGTAPANATPHYIPHAPCIDWTPASTNWPTANTGDTHFFICDGSYQNHLNPSAISISGVRNIGQAQSTIMKTKLLNAGYDVFVFKTKADYGAYFNVTPPAGLIGAVTVPGGHAPNHPGPLIAVFEIFCVNPPSGCVSIDYTNTGRVFNHEIGHAADNMAGNPSSNLSGPGTFRTQFDADIAQFNTLNNVNFANLPPVCNTGTNFAKLQCWFAIPFAQGTTDFYREFFAECYAGDQPIGGYPGNASVILRSYFRQGGMAPSTTVRSCNIANHIAQTP